MTAGWRDSSAGGGTPAFGASLVPRGPPHPPLLILNFFLLVFLLFFPLGSLGQPVVSDWIAESSAPAYGFRAQVERFSGFGVVDDSVLTVGAQVNAVNRKGVNQIVFGIATEAWAEQGSVSRLVGIEATTINREPRNWVRKIAMWATFKNRPDVDYFSPPADAANMDSQALRIESQPGTGFERGLVFAAESLRASRVGEAVVVDFREVGLERMKGWVLVRYPDGWCEFYAGAGRKEVRECAR